MATACWRIVDPAVPAGMPTNPADDNRGVLLSIVMVAPADMQVVSVGKSELMRSSKDTTSSAARARSIHERVNVTSAPLLSTIKVEFRSRLERRLRTPALRKRDCVSYWIMLFLVNPEI